MRYESHVFLNDGRKGWDLNPRMKKIFAGFRVRCRTELSHLSKMRRKGFEPSRPKGHMRLKHACLPFHHLRIVLLYSF